MANDRMMLKCVVCGSTKVIAKLFDVWTLRDYDADEWLLDHAMGCKHTTNEPFVLVYEHNES